MTPTDVIDSLINNYEGTVAVDAWGETGIFYNPGARLPRGVYVATVKTKDGDNDRASSLDREGIFRLNTNAGKPLYKAHFGPPPPRPAKGGVIEGPWDFTQTDTIMPHPVYGWMAWVCVLNPGVETLARMRPMLDASHAKAIATFGRRTQ